MLFETVIAKELEAIVDVIVYVFEFLEVAVVRFGRLRKQGFEDRSVEAERHLNVVEQGFAKGLPKEKEERLVIIYKLAVFVDLVGELLCRCHREQAEVLAQ